MKHISVVFALFLCGITGLSAQKTDLYAGVNAVADLSTDYLYFMGQQVAFPFPEYVAGLGIWDYRKKKRSGITFEIRYSQANVQNYFYPGPAEEKVNALHVATAFYPVTFTGYRRKFSLRMGYNFNVLLSQSSQSTPQPLDYSRISGGLNLNARYPIFSKSKLNLYMQLRVEKTVSAEFSNYNYLYYGYDFNPIRYGFTLNTKINLFSEARIHQRDSIWLNSKSKILNQRDYVKQNKIAKRYPIQNQNHTISIGFLSNVLVSKGYEESRRNSSGSGGVQISYFYRIDRRNTIGFRLHNGSFSLSSEVLAAAKIFSNLDYYIDHSGISAYYLPWSYAFNEGRSHVSAGVLADYIFSSRIDPVFTSTFKPGHGNDPIFGKGSNSIRRFTPGFCGNFSISLRRRKNHHSTLTYQLQYLPISNFKFGSANFTSYVHSFSWAYHWADKTHQRK